MEQRVKQLEAQVLKLQQMLAAGTMPLSLRETIRNEVVLKEDSEATLTQTVNTPAEGAPLSQPAAYIGTLIIRSKGKQYKVPYIT